MLLGERQLIMSRKVSSLPYDAEVEYLEGTGTQYIDTGVYLASRNVSCSFMFDFRPSTYVVRDPAEKAFFGISNWGSKVFGVNFTSVSGRGLQICTVTATNTSLTSIQRYNVYVSPSEATVNGSPVSIAYDTNFGRPGGNLFMFAVNAIDSSSVSHISPQDGRVYACKIWIGGSLVRDFIPVRFTNELGQSEGAMYDRVSKQLFRNAGTGAFLYGRDINPISTRSYVNDGLIAMWDGIENAGWGTHDAESTKWKDIVGGHDVTLGTGMSFASNALVCTAQGIATGTSISESIAAIEFVEFHSVRQDGMPFQLQSSRQCVLLSTRDTYSFSQNTTDSSMPYQFGSVHAVYVALASDGAIDTCYIDGVDVTSQKRARDANIGFYGGVRIGGATASYFPYAGSLHSLRVRSRALTAAEIAANYAVDKARFNLP